MKYESVDYRFLKELGERVKVVGNIFRLTDLYLLRARVPVERGEKDICALLNEIELYGLHNAGIIKIKQGE